MKFAPFENRMCRDIRNSLSDSFIAALKEKSMDPVHHTARVLEQKKTAPWHMAYINSRLTRYQTVLTRLESSPANMFTTACLIWDQALFFECHEWMEPFWIKAKGNDRKMIQALIRAAATYVLLEADRKSGAKKAANKSLAFLTANRSAIPPMFKPDLLIPALNALDSPPPRFMV